MSPPDKRNDEALVAAANRGDASAFETLYLRYRDWALRLAHRFTNDRDDALDVLQDTFAYLLGRFPGFRLSAKMTTFLYPVVKNLALTRRRRRLRLITNDEELPETSTPAADQTGNPSDLMVVLDALPEPQREVLLMRFVDNMSLAEIAAALEIPLGTVKSRLHNALNFLRRDERTRRYFDR